jgi:uncharacterized protein (DUF1778 family)
MKNKILKSKKDAEAFFSACTDKTIEPNEKLKAAKNRYQKVKQ